MSCSFVTVIFGAGLFFSHLFEFWGPSQRAVVENIMIDDAKLLQAQLEEWTMFILSCPRCQEKGTYAGGNQRNISCNPILFGPGFEIEGIVTCLADNHKWPIKFRNDQIVSIHPDLPNKASVKLHTAVPSGVRQDVEEAEKAHFGHCFKSSVVMSRRALQLALEDKGAKGRTLGPLLAFARTMNPPLLSARADTLAEGIKDYGDRGAHRPEEILSEDATLVISVTVMVLNELYPLTEVGPIIRTAMRPN